MFVIIYRLRVVHPHAQSMLQLINTCYGYEACGLFGALTLYRILSLVWTAALTTGLLFVEYDAENGLFWGALLCGVAPLFYTLMGGVYSLYSVHPLQAAILLIFSVSMFIAMPIPLTSGLTTKFKGQDIPRDVIDLFANMANILCTVVMAKDMVTVEDDFAGIGAAVASPRAPRYRPHAAAAQLQAVRLRTCASA